MTIKYGTNENWRWNGLKDVVEFSVNDSSREILCRVSRECIKDNFGNPSGSGACLTEAKARFDEITDLVGEKIARGQFEEDGTILVRSSDWRP